LGTPKESNKLQLDSFETIFAREKPGANVRVSLTLTELLPMPGELKKPASPSLGTLVNKTPTRFSSHSCFDYLLFSQVLPKKNSLPKACFILLFLQKRSDQNPHHYAIYWSGQRDSNSRPTAWESEEITICVWSIRRKNTSI